MYGGNMNVVTTLRNSFALILFLGCAMPALGQTPGAEDTSFNIGTLTQSGASLGFGMQPDDKVLVVTGSVGGFSVSRYLSDGRIDTSFGDGGTASVATFERGGVAAGRVAVDPLGRIYVYGGYSSVYAAPNSSRHEVGTAIARFFANGTVDTSFGTDGVIRHEYFHETNPSNPSIPPVTRVEGIPGMGYLEQFALLPDGKLLVVGSSLDSVTSLVFARFTVNGQFDASFGGTGYRTVDLGETLSVSVMEAGQDGSVVMLSRNDSTDELVFKLTAQGTLDTSFGSAGKVRLSDDAAYRYSLADLDIQPDGMILVAGSRVPVPGNEDQPYGNPSESILARLTAAGAPDRSFGSGGISALVLPERNLIDALALDSNGKILAAGTSTTIASNGVTTHRPFLVRTLPDGQVDTSFQQQVLDGSARTIGLDVSDAAYLLTLLSGAAPGSDGFEMGKFFIDPAPRTGSLNTGETPSASGFNVDALNASGMPVDSATTSQLVGLHGYIYTQGEDLDASADVFVVASTARGWFMRTTSGAFVPWSGRVADLVPAYESVQLTERTYVSIYGGALPFAGSYAIYLGYMRDGGPLVYTEAPAVLQIAE
jgi:uncharacterized delta-60 repeat protein